MALWVSIFWYLTKNPCFSLFEICDLHPLLCLHANIRTSQIWSIPVYPHRMMNEWIWPWTWTKWPMCIFLLLWLVLWPSSLPHCIWIVHFQALSRNRVLKCSLAVWTTDAVLRALWDLNFTLHIRSPCLSISFFNLRVLCECYFVVCASLLLLLFYCEASLLLLLFYCDLNSSRFWFDHAIQPLLDLVYEICCAIGICSI